MIQHTVPARAALLGNPSDGYGGRTMAMAVANWSATVSLIEDDVVRISGPQPQPFEFESIGHFADHVDRFGFGTGEELVAAALRTFLDLADSQGWRVRGGADITFHTTIPRSVGLAGSSAIVIAALRCLLDWTERSLEPHLLAALALSAEVDQMGISAGLQDRVVQSYGGLVAMDFGHMTTDPHTGLRYGGYEPLDPDLLPNLFVAYSPAAASPSSVYHRELRRRFGEGDHATVAGLHELAQLVPEGKAALRWGSDTFGDLIGRSMELRRNLAPIPPEQLELVDAADELGLPATFAGSGGAIVGTYTDDLQLERLNERLTDPEAVVRPVFPAAAAPLGGEGDDPQPADQ